MMGVDWEIVIIFDGFLVIVGVILFIGKYVCVVVNLDVVIKLEVVNGGFMCLGVVIKLEVVKGGFVGSGIGWVRFCICCFFCNKVVCRVLILFVKVERLRFENIGSKLVKLVEKSLKI